MRYYGEILFYKLFSYFPFMKRACIDHNVKLLHIHFGYQGFKFLHLKKKMQVPMVCSFYGDDAFSFPSNLKRRKLYSRLFSECDRVLVLGPYMKQELIKLGCPSGKIYIHHLGIDVSKMKFNKRANKAKGDAIKFLIASSFVEKKGVDVAIKALSRVKDIAEFTLDVIGDGPLRPRILEEIKAGALEDRVTLHGYRPYEYFIDKTHSCDVFIQASRTGGQNNKEGTPMAIVDAMAAGMAVIATRHSDIPEVVTDNVHGFLAEENSVDSLVGCFTKMFESLGSLEFFSIKARAHVEEYFNASLQTQKLESYYSELLS
jgi:colanic acid/amylovoran biosynthesis glycosyltransferase